MKEVFNFLQLIEILWLSLCGGVIVTLGSTSMVFIPLSISSALKASGHCVNKFEFFIIFRVVKLTLQYKLYASQLAPLVS